MAIETVTLHFTSGEKFEITADKITSGNLMVLPTTNLEGEEYQLMVRWEILNSDIISAEILKAGLEQSFGNT